MPFEPLIEAIELELNRLTELLEKYAPLIQKSKTQEPDFFEIASLAVLLHAFYNGLENIFTRIARKIDGEIPNGKSWHQDLLAQMERETAKRKMIVVSAVTATELQEYLGFRHFARHAYPLDLEWDLMKDLIERLPVLHSRVLAEIGAFVAYLKTLPTTTQSHETKDQYGGEISFFRWLRQTIRSFFSSVLVLNAVEAAPPHSVRWR